jgi:hypothetical protein
MRKSQLCLIFPPGRSAIITLSHKKTIKFITSKMLKPLDNFLTLAPWYGICFIIALNSRAVADWLAVKNLAQPEFPARSAETPTFSLMVRFGDES